MALLLENYGLDAFCDDDKAGNELMHYIVHCGTAKYGYRGLPYIFTPMGNLEFWTKTKKSDDDEHEFSVSEINIHCGNQCVWEAVLTGIDITPKKDLELGRLAFFKKTDGTGSDLPIEVLNADVIPSWMENDRITMQVVAMPLDI